MPVKKYTSAKELKEEHTKKLIQKMLEIFLGSSSGGQMTIFSDEASGIFKSWHIWF